MEKCSQCSATLNPDGVFHIHAGYPGSTPNSCRGTAGDHHNWVTTAPAASVPHQPFDDRGVWTHASHAKRCVGLFEFSAGAGTQYQDSGTCFVIGPDCVVTTAHGVIPRNDNAWNSARLFKAEFQHIVRIARFRATFQQASTRTLEPIAYDMKADLCLLRNNGKPFGVHLSLFGGKVQTTMDVVMCGCPGAVRMRNLRKLCMFKGSVACDDLGQEAVASYKGAIEECSGIISGGAVLLALNGEVLGVHTESCHDTDGFATRVGPLTRAEVAEGLAQKDCVAIFKKVDVLRKLAHSNRNQFPMSVF